MPRKKQRDPFMRETRRADGVKTFTVQVRVKKHSASATFDSKDAAVEWHNTKRAEFEALSKRGHVTRDDVSRLTVADLIDEHLKDPATLAQKSLADTKNRLAWWTNEIGAVKALDLGLTQVRAARVKLMKGRKASTVNRTMASMRSAWNWGIAAGFVPEDHPWPKRTMLPQPKGRVRYLSVDELNGLLETAEADAMIEAGIVLALTTGLRISEMLRLEWADLDLVGGKLAVHKSKNDEPRQVHLPAKCVTALKKWRKVALVGPTCLFVGPGGKIRITYKRFAKRWRVVRAAAGLKNFRWHDLRHSCASFLANEGANLLEIGSVLGHKSPQSTAIYAHLVQGKALKEHAIFDKLLK